MEMAASFTQTPDGLDNWGHDIIFEFSGDDDMWLYLDGELVLDLGGVHSAMAGSINFRTGAVKTSRTTTTLRALFSSNYKARNPGASAQEVNEYLDRFFKDGGTVFKDYSTHSMKMFYMERGAGSSNLYMRFNLTSVKPGQVLLSKEISGTDKQDYDLAQFPYQIWYKTEAEDAQAQLLTPGEELFNVTYERTGVPVVFAKEYTPAGTDIVYENVFFLKPGQTAAIEMPGSGISYRIVECGVNTDIYDTVSANDTVLAGTPVSGNRSDFAVGEETAAQRPKVVFNNHVDPDAKRTLSITKKLYDEKGDLLTREEDPASFTFRVSLGGEDDASPVLCNMQPYYVKDPHGNYCRWDHEEGRFVSIGKTDFEDLTQEEETEAVFTTSPNGSISRIPAGYTVEMRELLVGTKFKVEERDYEIPAGYALTGYERVDGTYIAEEGDQSNTGMIRDNSDPNIEIHNQRGWGLTVHKVWSDAQYMASHAPVYMAVYARDVQGESGLGADGTQGTDDAHGAGDAGHLTLLPGTVRQMKPGVTSLYYYFDSLLPGTVFSDYVVREVMIRNTDPSAASDGTVTDPGEITPVDDGESLELTATPKGENTAVSYLYTVSYSTGTLTGENENARIDTVTNTRPGIRLIKKDVSGAFLAGAVFTLVNTNGTLSDADDLPVGSGTFRSGEDGLITTAYLKPGSYLLTETKTPDGYTAGTPVLTILVKDNNEVQVTDENGDPYEGLGELSDGTPVITVTNRPFALQVLKKDQVSDAPLEGVRFSLYRQVTGTDGNVRKDYRPMEGYADLATDADGRILLSGHRGSSGDMYSSGDAETSGEVPAAENVSEVPVLAAGTYYLSETEELPGYAKQEKDICFSVSAAGSVTLLSSGTGVTLQQEMETDGCLISTLIIPNRMTARRIRIRKVGGASAKENEALAGAVFDLSMKSTFTGLVSGSDGYLPSQDPTDPTLFTLPFGTWQLSERDAPEGYLPIADPVQITVSSSGVSVSEDSSQAWCSEPDEDGIVTVTVLNRKTENISIAKVLKDPLERGRSFTFTVVIDSKEQELTLQDSQTITLAVPVGASVQILETGDTQMYDTAITWNRTDPEDEDFTGDEENYRTDAANKKASIAGVKESALVTFTNVRKTAVVRIRKLVDAKDTAGTFQFSAVCSRDQEPVSGLKVLNTKEAFSGTGTDPRDGETSGDSGSDTAGSSAAEGAGHEESAGSGTTLVRETDETGAIRLFSLSHEEIQTLRVPVGITVTVTETAEKYTASFTWDGVKGEESAHDKTYILTIPEDGTTASVTYVNTPDFKKVLVLKVDSTDREKRLEGASFSLYVPGEEEPVLYDLYRRLEGSTKAEYVSNYVQDWTTNQEGILTDPSARVEDASMELMVGEYLLRESAPPAGYTSLSHDIEIFVYSDSVIYKQ